MTTKTVAILVLALAAVPALAVDHIVGGNAGWNLGANYESWASGRTFTVGDTLTFRYGGGHTVDTLSSKSEYDGCSTGNAVKTDSSSPTTITLSEAGTTYYACGAPGHCQQGMKLAVTTVAASSGTPSSSPTSPSGTNTPPTSTGALPANSAAGAVSGVNAVLLAGAVMGLALLG